MIDLFSKWFTRLRSESRKLHSVNIISCCAMVEKSEFVQKRISLWGIKRFLKRRRWLEKRLIGGKLRIQLWKEAKAFARIFYIENDCSWFNVYNVGLREVKVK